VLPIPEVDPLIEAPTDTPQVNEVAIVPDEDPLRI